MMAFDYNSGYLTLRSGGFGGRRDDRRDDRGRRDDRYEDRSRDRSKLLLIYFCSVVFFMNLNSCSFDFDFAGYNRRDDY